MKRRQSLLSKIIVAVSLAVLVVEGVVLVPLLAFYRAGISQVRTDAAQRNARIVEVARDSKDPAVLEKQLAIYGGAVYDDRLDPVAGAPLTRLADGAAPTDADLEQVEAAAYALFEARRTGQTVGVERGGRLIHAVPLAGGGFFARGSSIDPFPGNLAAQVVLAMGLILAVLLSTGIWTIAALYRHILRPLGALTAANRALVEGNEAEALVPEDAIPEDELGDAIRSRNEIYRRMLDYQRSIREKNEILRRQGVELKKWTVELERRVREKSDELLRTNDRLLESEKLAAAGRLAAGVAHEINNPLASIAGYAEDLLTLAKDPALRDVGAFRDFPESLAVIEEQAFRCKRIIRQLLTFARPTEFAPSPIDLAQVVDDVLPLVEHKARGRDIAISIDEKPGTPNAYADRTHLMQVLVNLLENAFDAIEGPTGEIQVAIRRSTPRNEGSLGLIAIDVRDSGKGISEANRRKIFEPFFTTKPVGQGTGLGLSICHSIVSRMGGRIEVASEVGRGTTFTVLLPATAELAAIEA